MKKGCLGAIAIFFIIACVVWECDHRNAVDLEKQCHVACEQNDYEKAHNLLLQLKETGEYYYYEETKEYVFKQEALYLMSLEDEAAKKRIVYLLKEEGNDNKHVSMLIDLAIENDDEPFVKTLGNQFTKETKSEDLKKLMEYLYSKQSEGNKDYLIGSVKKLDKKELGLEIGFKFKDIDYILNAIDTVKIEDEILLGKLVQLNVKKVSDLIIGSLSVYENKIPEKPLRIGTYTTGGWGALVKLLIKSTIIIKA